MAKNKTNLIGSWAFLIGVILSIIVGFVGSRVLSPTILTILVVLGLIVGLLNITRAEAGSFLISGAVLVIVSSLGSTTLEVAIPALGRVLDALLAIFVPATITVAIRNSFSLAHK